MFIPGAKLDQGGTAIFIVKDANGKTIDTVTVVLIKKSLTGGIIFLPKGLRGGTIKFIMSEPVQVGSLRVVSGPGKAVLNTDGTVMVISSRNAKPGQLIVVDSLDKDGNATGGNRPSIMAGPASRDRRPS